MPLCLAETFPGMMQKLNEWNESALLMFLPPFLPRARTRLAHLSCATRNTNHEFLMRIATFPSPSVCAIPASEALAKRRGPDFGPPSTHPGCAEAELIAFQPSIFFVIDCRMHRGRRPVLPCSLQLDISLMDVPPGTFSRTRKIASS